MTCPICGEECERDTVDAAGVKIPAAPWSCPWCWWSEPEVDRVEQAQAAMDAMAGDEDV